MPVTNPVAIVVAGIGLVTMLFGFVALGIVWGVIPVRLAVQAQRIRLPAHFDRISR